MFSQHLSGPVPSRATCQLPPSLYLPGAAAVLPLYPPTRPTATLRLTPNSSHLAACKHWSGVRLTMVNVAHVSSSSTSASRVLILHHGPQTSVSSVSNAKQTPNGDGSRPAARDRGINQVTQSVDVIAEAPPLLSLLLQQCSPPVRCEGHGRVGHGRACRPDASYVPETGRGRRGSRGSMPCRGVQLRQHAAAAAAALGGTLPQPALTWPPR